MNNKPENTILERRKMDALNIKTAFIKKAISKVLTEKIKKKLGVAVELNIEELQMIHADGKKIAFLLKVNGEMPESEISKLI